MSEKIIRRCPDLIRRHQRTHGLTARSCRDATGKFAVFEREDFDTKALKWVSCALGLALLAVVIW